jgi:maltose-binding protein MalE
MIHKPVSNPRHGLRPAVFRKYFFPISLILLCGFSLLAGCQLQNIITQQGEPTATGAASSNPAADLTPDLAQPSVTTAPVTTLVLWLPPQLDPANGSLAGAILQERLDSFEQEHPQYTVDVRIKGLNGEGGMQSALESASSIAPAALPSLVALPYSIMDSSAANNLLEPISSETIGINDPDWLPFARDIARIDSLAYGVPFGADALVLAYRPLLVPEPPQTWEGIINQEQFVSFPAADESATVVTQIYLSAGGNLQTNDGAPMLELEPLQSALQVLQEGAQREVFPTWIAGYATFDESWQTFENQQAYYAVIWSSQYLHEPLESVAITSLPQIGDVRVTLLQGWLWCVPAYSTTSDQDSLLLLEYLSDPAFANRWAQAAGYLPVRESGLESWRDLPDAQFVMDLVRGGQMVPFRAPNEITTPMLQDAAIQIIMKQAYYQTLLDDIMSHFQVQ